MDPLRISTWITWFKRWQLIQAGRQTNANPTTVNDNSTIGYRLESQDNKRSVLRQKFTLIATSLATATFQHLRVKSAAPKMGITSLALSWVVIWISQRQMATSRWRALICITWTRICYFHQSATMALAPVTLWSQETTQRLPEVRLTSTTSMGLCLAKTCRTAWTDRLFRAQRIWLPKAIHPELEDSRKASEPSQLRLPLSIIALSIKVWMCRVELSA